MMNNLENFYEITLITVYQKEKLNRFVTLLTNKYKFTLVENL